MILRSGYRYNEIKYNKELQEWMDNHEDLWWYRYTKEGCIARGSFEAKEGEYSLFEYNKYTIKEFQKTILPLYVTNWANNFYKTPLPDVF